MFNAAEYQQRIDFNKKFAAQNGFASGLPDSPDPATRAYVDWTVDLQRKVGLKVDGYFGSDTFKAYQKSKGVYVEPGELIPEDTSPGVIAYGRSIGSPSGVQIVRWFDNHDPDVPFWYGWGSSREGVPINWLAVHEPVGSLEGTWRSFEKMRGEDHKYSHGTHFTIGLDGTIYQHNPLEYWLVNLPGMNKRGISIEPINRVNGKYRNGTYEAPSPYEGLILPADWVDDGDTEGYTVPPLVQLNSFVRLSNFLLGMNVGAIQIADDILGYDRAQNRFLIGRIDNWKKVKDDPSFVPSSIVAHKWVGNHSDGIFYLLVLTLYRELGYPLDDAQAMAAHLLQGAEGQWIDLPPRRGPRQTGNGPTFSGRKGYSSSGAALTSSGGTQREYTQTGSEAEDSGTRTGSTTREPVLVSALKYAGMALTALEIWKRLKRRK